MIKKKQVKRTRKGARDKASAAQRALKNLEKGNTQAALAWAGSVASDIASQEDSWAAAMILMRSDYPQRALRIYEQLHRAQPENRDVSFALACCNAELGAADGLTIFESKLPDADANAYTQFARALEKGGALSAAADLLAPVLPKFPADPELAMTLARIRTSLGDRDAGEAILQECVNQGIIDPQLRARAWFNLGVSQEAGNSLDRDLAQRDLTQCERSYRNAIDSDVSYSNAWINLAVLLIGANRSQEAIELLQQAKIQFPNLPKILYLAAYAHRLNDDTLHAVEELEVLVDATDDHVQGWDLLGRCLVDLERFDAAVSHYRRWLSVKPNQPIAVHMLAALEEKDVPDRASAAFVAETFDTFADTFDSTLSRLEYRGPELMRQLLRDNLVDVQPRSLTVLDAGCGTGLMGDVLNEYAKTLDGVDLSQEMLRRAKMTNAYDRLTCADLLDYLQESTERYDLIVAADTFNYFGDLSTLLPRCFAALKTGGWLLFSLEQGPLSDDCFTLQPHGRYVHSPHYLVWQMGEVGITGGTMRKVVLRKENDQDVHGLLFATQRPE